VNALDALYRCRRAWEATQPQLFWTDDNLWGAAAGEEDSGSGLEYVVEVLTGRGWRKVRGPEGGPWRTRDRAERIAQGREASDRRTSSTEGLPHRVVQRGSR
jgi:hypothetical protein